MYERSFVAYTDKGLLHIQCYLETFAIVKNNSNEKSPKYSVAYEDIHFDRSDIVYFVEYIFKNTINAK